MLKKLNIRNIYGKVRVLFGVTAFFLLLTGITVQAARTTKTWLANKEEWEGESGYHLGAVAQTKDCGHLADDSYAIPVSIEGSGLMPDQTYLKSNFSRKGAFSLIPKKYQDQINKNKIYFETLKISGLNNHMVSTQVAKIKINGSECVLAAPYLCPDGYAGYAYFRHYFSYCSNTGAVYHTGTSEHVWLGCTRGEVGINEYHPRTYEHKIYRYYVEPNNYTITYDGNGETSGSTTSQKATYDTALNLRNNGFKKTGNTFVEWNTERDGSGTAYAPGKSVKNLTAKDGGKITLYARWEKADYQLTVKPNGGTWGGKTTDQEFTLDYGATKTIANPSRTGYTFSGWTRTGAGSSLSGTAFKMGTANATLTAKWTVNSYKLTVKPNGGTWSGATTDQEFTLNYGATKVIANPSRTGYAFSGWTVSGTGSSLTGTIFTMGSANATLTAKWTVNSYKLTVKPNGGTWEGKTTDQEFTLNYGATKAIENPARTGYTFSGWTLSGTGSSLTGTTFTMGSANATLTAKWTINSYKLTVKPNGGTWEGKTGNQNFALNYGATKTIADPICTGYTFIGWTLSGTGSCLTGTTFTMGSEDSVLMANWTANTYIISFDGNGATEGSMDPITATVDVPIQLPANVFKRTTEQGESQFIGWALIPEPEGNIAEFADQMVVERNLAQEQEAIVTLYAIWDDCPMIDACNRYFTLKAAQEGKITEKELLSTAKAVDRENAVLENKTASQIAEDGINGSLSLYGYAATDFISMANSGSVSMTYKAVDDIGNTVYDTIIVYITDSDPIAQTDFQYTRFINEKYYDASYEAGGLHPESVWLNIPDYQSVLKKALENLRNDTPIAAYKFSNDKVVEVQNHIEDNESGKIIP